MIMTEEDKEYYSITEIQEDLLPNLYKTKESGTKQFIKLNKEFAQKLSENLETE